MGMVASSSSTSSSSHQSTVYYTPQSTPHNPQQHSWLPRPTVRFASEVERISACPHFYNNVRVSPQTCPACPDMQQDPLTWSKFNEFISRAYYAQSAWSAHLLPMEEDIARLKENPMPERVIHLAGDLARRASDFLSQASTWHAQTTANSMQLICNSLPPAEQANVVNIGRQYCHVAQSRPGMWGPAPPTTLTPSAPPRPDGRRSVSSLGILTESQMDTSFGNVVPFLNVLPRPPLHPE